MTYELIYTDPPWKYGGSPALNHSASVYYETLTDEELKAMDIPAADDCLMFMWVPSPHMKNAIEIGEHWGFKYVTVAFVWHKKVPNPGNYTMSECEMVLLFRKGKMPKKAANNVRQFLQECRSVHSKKPDEIRNRIATMYPHLKKIEMFARKQSEGWDVFGNEIDKFND